MTEPQQVVMTQITVKWIDSCGPEDHWRLKAEVLDLAPVTFITTGWLLAESDEFITIANSVGNNGNFGGVICIPKVVIQHESRRPLKERW
jgi:hypothetical protein